MIEKRKKLTLFKTMIAIREFEKIIKDLYRQDYIEGAIHCYTGEEAVATGVCTQLKDTDYVFSTHRGHGHALALKCDLKRIFAELMGKKTGLSGGYGGSMHLFDPSKGLMGGNGIVGAGLSLSLGTAYTAKYKKNDNVTVCFFSEGASNQGTFHESLNMASLYKLPLIYACENNLFAATTPSYKTLSNPDIYKRAKSYNIKGIVVDGNDVEDVYNKTKEAIEYSRQGNGPVLIEYKTYRVEGHCMVLNDLEAHRPKDVVEYWRSKDPIDNYEKKLIKEGFDDNIRKKILEEVKDEFSQAIEFAKKSEYPDKEKFLSAIKERYAI